jgi:hypothetical protein
MSGVWLDQDTCYIAYHHQWYILLSLFDESLQLLLLLLLSLQRWLRVLLLLLQLLVLLLAMVLPAEVTQLLVMVHISTEHWALCKTVWQRPS